MSGRHGSLASVENVVYTSAVNITYGSPATPFRSKNAAKDGTEYSKHPPSDSLVRAPAKTGVRSLIEPCTSVRLHHVFQFATNISILLKIVVSSYQLRISVSSTQYSDYRDPSARHEYLSHTENRSQPCVTSDRFYISIIVPVRLFAQAVPHHACRLSIVRAIRFLRQTHEVINLSSPRISQPC
ncbi:hypothetical protein GE21DRAFT_1014607 [Neurospora crassa]|nr:hypothetical protein GE21DRAFT_1014607 [Neurospora crassa]